MKSYFITAFHTQTRTQSTNDMLGLNVYLSNWLNVAKYPSKTCICRLSYSFPLWKKGVNYKHGHLLMLKKVSNTYFHWVVKLWNAQLSNSTYTDNRLFHIWNSEWTASRHEHPVCQNPVGDTEKLNDVWLRYFGTNWIIDNWHWCLGVMWRIRKNISICNWKNFFSDWEFLFHWSICTF